MFFPHLMNIKRNDLVLEVGPGSSPHWRSDCLVDKYNGSSDVDLTQFGGLPHQTDGKPFFEMKDGHIPFKNDSFNYLICSHVLEHVPSDEIQSLLSEIMRVSKKAYIEFPRPLYDYVYNFNSHLNFMDIVDNTIICLDKRNTSLEKMINFTAYALELRRRCEYSIELINPSVAAVGKEFSSIVPLKICNTEQEFFDIIFSSLTDIKMPSISQKIASKLNRAFFHRNSRYIDDRLQNLLLMPA